MSTIKQFFLLLLTLFLSNQSQAADNRVHLEPIYGMETSLVRYPAPSRYLTRGTYGLRALYGGEFLAGEFEYSEADSRNDYPGSSQKVYDRSQRVSLGLRSTIPLSTFFSFYARGGGRASQGKSEVTTLGNTQTINNPLRIDPYAGAGLHLSFSNSIGLNAGATLIRNAVNQFDVQYILGLNAHIGSF